MKQEYGPTLGALLAPRWHAASPLTRRTLTVAGVALLVAVVAGVLTLLNASYSHGGRVPFSFGYRGLHRVAPDPGGYVKVERRHADGTLRDSFAVLPLRLPPYSGGLAGELPLYATGYIRALSGRYAGFELRGEGKTKVNNMPAYHVFYRAVVEGRRVYGRDVLIVPERPGARDGVDIVILTPAPRASKLTSPMEVANKGILATPLKSFSLG
ncbi:MAG TPA: hypothetical protein VGN08_02310 [Solirubrobacteraceae bacterium]